MLSVLKTHTIYSVPYRPGVHVFKYKSAFTLLFWFCGVILQTQQKTFHHFHQAYIILLSPRWAGLSLYLPQIYNEFDLSSGMHLLACCQFGRQSFFQLTGLKKGWNMNIWNRLPYLKLAFLSRATTWGSVWHNKSLCTANLCEFLHFFQYYFFIFLSQVFIVLSV